VVRRIQGKATMLPLRFLVRRLAWILLPICEALSLGGALSAFDSGLDAVVAPSGKYGKKNGRAVLLGIF
jgi:hypothetical protein